MRHFYIVLNGIPKLLKKNVDHGEVSDEIAELCSCIRAALFLSHDIRRNVKVHLVLLGERRDIVIDGRSVRYLSPDERSICMLLIKLNERRSKTPWRGVYVNEFKSLQEVFPSDAVFLMPSEDGVDLRQVKNLKEVMVVVPLTSPSEYMEELNHERIVFVKTWGRLHPSHLIIILNNQMDIAEEQEICTP